MKVLMVMQHINFFRNLDTVVRELDARGHQTVMLHGTRLDDPKSRAKFKKKSQKMVFMGRGIEHAEAAIPSVTTGYRPEPPEPRQERLRVGRQVMNLSIYLRDGHPAPDRVREGLQKRLPEPARKRADSRLFRAAIRRRLALRTWRRFERMGAPSDLVTSLLAEIEPDVVLVSPTVWPKNPVEADYIYAARKLGIPTIGYVNSWDNLTSKGTVHVLPDVYIVWNEPMAREARELHDIPEKIIRVTGAPHLDHFFDLTPSLSRAEACEQLECPDDRPYVVYLSSSRTLIDNETHIVTALAEALAREFPERPPTIVVRPHPVNPGPWEGYEHEGVTVFPKHGDQADTPDAWQEYFNQLFYSSCFFGLNTTAFLEAAVVDRPCLTVVAEEFHDVQGRTGHFRHLIDADFLEVSGDMTETATRVRRVLDGADEKAESRRQFAESFLRPRGVETPAASVVADTIEELGAPVTTVPPGETSEKPRLEPTLKSSSDTLAASGRGNGAEPDGRPFFTIAIPTKNRPDRVRNAVKSVLDQTFADVEVIVCDNSDEAESRQTAAAVEELSDPRVRYIRTNGRLSMPDNWETAVAQARGEYVGILTDRSVFRRDALEVVRHEIEETDAPVVTWFNDLYARDPEGTEFKPRPCSLNRYRFSSEMILDYFLHGHPKYSNKIIPKLMTSVCHSSVLDDVRSSSAGRVCLPVAPDFTSGFLMLGHADWVLTLDEALYVSCGTGNGADFRRGGELADRFRRELGMEWHEMVDRMPSDACFAHALVLNDLMRVRDVIPDRLPNVEVDRAQYYLGCLQDYWKTSRHGVKRDEDLSALLEALDREPQEVKDKVKATKLFHQASASHQGRQKLRRRVKEAISDDAPRLRFDDVFEALAWVEANPRPPASRSFVDLTIGLDDLKLARVRGGRAKRQAAGATTTVAPKAPAAPMSPAPEKKQRDEQPQQKDEKPRKPRQKKGKKKRKKKVPLGKRVRRGTKPIRRGTNRVRASIRLRTRLRQLRSSDRVDEASEQVPTEPREEHGASEPETGRVVEALDRSPEPEQSDTTEESDGTYVKQDSRSPGRTRRAKPTPAKDFRHIAETVKGLSHQKQLSILELWPGVEVELEEDVKITARSSKELRRFTRPIEPATLDWIRGFEPEDVFYDIGANCGNLTLAAGAIHRGSIEIVAFEPGYANFESLVRNLSRNELLGSCVPLQVALLDRTGLNRMNYYKSTDAGTSLHAVGEPVDHEGRAFEPVEAQMMPTFALDDLIEALELPDPTRVKIDVDGYEESVLRGAPKTLTNGTIDELAVEIVDHDRQGTRPESVRGLLKEHGYDLAETFRHHGEESFVADYLFRRSDRRPPA